MKKDVYILVDYKNKFSSNYGSKTYRGGLDHDILEVAFSEYEINIIWKSFSEIDFTDDWDGKIVLYTSSEDDKVLYKSYIEDIVYGLELQGAVVIPKFRYLRAHHNKVFMEILRSRMGLTSHLKSLFFGTSEEAVEALSAGKIPFPCVIKAAAGAMSRAVAKASDRKEFIKVIADMSKTTNLKSDARDFLRCYKHKNYIPESSHRNKFIVQPMIQGLANDWKILIYGDKIFNLKRYVRKNDFRASGSHVNYQIGSASGLTSQMMDFVYDIYKKMDIPMLSFDLAYDGKNYHMIEFQALYFGTSTFELSKDYYEREGTEWILKPKVESKLEYLFAYAVSKYISEHNL